jgi:hypothetical protein
MCGDRLFDEGKKYLIEVQCTGQRGGENDVMMVFVDDMHMYEVRPGESISFAVEAGFHTIKFRHKIRSRSISLLVSCSYSIRAYFNTLSGLIETSVNMVENSAGGLSASELTDKKLTKPVMVSEDGKRSFDVMLGDDDPEYEIKVTSGLKEGILRIYSERLEFSPSDELKKDIINYKNVTSVKRKMGSIDVQCEGNVHKVYSIPKDIYNEVLAFLTNRVGEVQGKN